MLFGSTYTSSDANKKSVLCVLCGHVNILGTHTLSACCQHCKKSMKLDEIRIKDYQSRRVVDTCSSFVLEANGNIKADKIFCATAIVFGRAKTEIVSRGTVFIGAGATVTGDVTALSIQIPEGAVLEGYYRIGPAHAIADPKPTVGAEGDAAGKAAA